ncbi:MAG: ABC transporter permease [Acidimicrobiia bacterium]|nr:ABC transporter permease [Acidimicrobiia bacterium]
MVTDLRTVMWKEWRTLVHQPGGRLRLLLAVSVPILYFGVVGPLQAGARFVDDADPWFVVVVLPVLAVVVTAPDAFAGERERKTLRTLLASRLTDRAILWGKIGFAILLGIGSMLGTLALALVVVNLSAGDGDLILIAGWRLAHMLGVSVLLTVVAAGTAVLVSQRSSTVQQAQQILAAIFFLVPTALGPVALLLSQEGQADAILDVFRWLDTPAGRFGLLAGLAATAVAVLTAARAGFRRPRLVGG